MNALASKRWLLASLILNLFLLGGVAGGLWRWWAAERAGQAATAQPRGLRFAADALSAEQRRAYRLGLRDARRELAPVLQTAREGRQQVLQLMAAPQYDAAAVTAALARTREADQALRARLEASVVEFATTLSAPERQQFADGLARRSTLRPPANAPAKSAP